MATTSGDLQLYKPQYSEAADIAKINDNSDAIDAAVTANNTKITSVQDGLAIVANGNTHAAIAANQFVYVKNHNTLAEGLYRANSAIGANAALTTSNVTADANGGLNALKSDLDSLNSNIAKDWNPVKSWYTTQDDACEFHEAHFGSFVVLSFITNSKVWSENDVIFTVPSGFKPSMDIKFNASMNRGSDNVALMIKANGECLVWYAPSYTSASRIWGSVAYVRNP